VSFDRGGPWAWSASYVLSEAKDRLAGVWVPRPLDQRHAFGVTIAYHPSSRWQFSSTFQYHTGWPATASGFATQSLPGATIVRAREIGELNALRLPPYHRLDFRVSRNFNVGRGLLQAYLDVFNLYNRTNLRGYTFFPEVSGGRVRIRQVPGAEMLPILPSLGIRWEF
jgi:hypothetical protein